MPRSGRPLPISLPLDPLPLPDLAGGEWSVKTKEGGGGDDAVEEEDEGKARWRKGRRALDLSGGSENIFAGGSLKDALMKIYFLKRYCGRL
uniref:Uncharacterized protein n=1 Tax=Oryza glaberrima TaxID=4538 RepID=I1R739_ORYGL